MNNKYLEKRIEKLEPRKKTTEKLTSEQMAVRLLMPIILSTSDDEQSRETRQICRDQLDKLGFHASDEEIREMWANGKIPDHRQHNRNHSFEVGMIIINPRLWRKR